ncbi:MAG TPA: hypothetical protein VNV82_12695 [Bryobacteraceae bacterium]|nr:hypothetical protein [Bryobacteraceae bacterium]
MKPELLLVATNPAEELSVEPVGEVELSVLETSAPVVMMMMMSFRG